MSIQEESSVRSCRAPNAILEHMRRRVSRVGLLVAIVTLVLSASVIFFLCACANLRL